jgi:hypothetical protein
MPYARSLERAAQVNEEKIYRAAQAVLAESGMLSRGVGAPSTNGPLAARRLVAGLAAGTAG